MLINLIIKKNLPFYCFLLTVYFISFPTNAGFLDMPDLSETPGLKRETMLRDVDIPEVGERNPDPTAGPRLAVSEFRIQGLVEYPELGITREAIDDLVEKIRFEMMAEDKLLESGYTLEELGELSDLLVDIEKETIGRHVTPIEVQKIVWLVREQRSKRGITLGQIETIADRITKFYRERGFVLAKAYIPKQEVRDGIVNLTLLLGTLGDAQVNNNEMYSDSIIKSVFDDMLTKPVTHDAVEERLYLINDFPGLIVDGYFEPGYQVGDTKLNVNVKDESRYHANIRLDNHGTDETGLYRLYGDFQFNNLLGLADHLNLSLLEASSPSNTSYWRVNFQSNLFSPRWKLIMDASKNQFVVDQKSVLAGSGLSIQGDVFVYDISTRYYLTRSRTKNYNFEFKYEDIESDLQLADFPDPTGILDEQLTQFSLLFNYDILNEAKQRLHQGNVKLISGTVEHSAALDKGLEPDYNILTAEYSWLTFWKIPFVDANSRVIFRTSFQYAGQNLSPIVRAPLGGPTRARAFPTNLYTADDGIYLGVDWLFNSPFYRENLTPFVFVDMAYGQQYKLITDLGDSTAYVSDVGIGVQFSYRHDLRGTFQIAQPISANFRFADVEKSSTEDTRVVFDIQYSFF